MGKRKWICCQIGAREHYAVARALHQGGRLAAVYTDFWANQAFRKLAGGVRFGGTMRSLAARFHPGLADAPVQSWNWRSIGWEAALRYRWGGGGGVPYAGYIEVARRFTARVREALRRRTDLGADSIFFAYDTGALEAFEWCRERGITCVLNQMDPNRAEVHLVQEEEQRWPGWSTEPIEASEEYFSRREREWALADRVVLNSEFCAAALAGQGVPREKLAVIPLCFEPDFLPGEQNKDSAAEKPRRSSPLRVLWLGQVIVRKGIQYLMETARQLAGENIHFDIVGPIGISQAALASAPKNMTFHGRASRSQAKEWYRQGDIFVLPTLSDGFAITQLEAMAYGLPVIATPCCGAVVNDGVDGFLVAPRDAVALAGAFRRYLDEPGLLKPQRAAALKKSRMFTLDHLAENLRGLELSLCQRGVKS